MKFHELHAITKPLADELDRLAEFAEADEFAPWVVEALRIAGRYARLDEDVLDAAGRKVANREAGS